MTKEVKLFSGNLLNTMCLYKKLARMRRWTTNIIIIIMIIKKLIRKAQQRVDLDIPNQNNYETGKADGSISQRWKGEYIFTLLMVSQQQ